MADNYDGEIRINTNIDTSNVDGGVKKLKKKLSDLGNTQVIKGLSNIGATVSGIGVAFSAASASVQKVTDTIKELTDLYKTQMQAEIQLETAAKTNPYLNSQSVQQLKDFAAELQGIGTVGDESLMPLMAQLASSGRTQTEIQQIMAAALDASASGVISLESAVSGLNMSYSGSAGMLARVLPQIKGLTEEELKQGKAVEVVAKSYKGMAEQVTKSTGSAQQLANAWGDLKEELGAPFEKAMRPMRNFFTELVSGFTNALSARRKFNEAQENVKNGNATATDYDVLIKHEKEYIESLEKRRKTAQSLAEQYKVGTDAYRDAAQTLNTLNKEIAEEYANLRILEFEYKKLIGIEEKESEEEKKAREEAEKTKALQDKLKTSTDNYNVIEARRKATIDNIKRTAELTGEEVDQQAILNAEMQAYLEMAQDPLLPTRTEEQKQRVIELIGELKEQAAAIETVNKALDKMDEIVGDTIDDANEFLSQDNEAKLSDTIQAAIDALEKEKAQFEGNAEAVGKFEEKIRELKTLLPQVRTAEFKLSIDDAQGEGEIDRLQELQDKKLALQEQHKDMEVSLALMSKEERIKIQEDYAKAMENLDKEIAEEQERQFQEKLTSITELMSQITSYINQTASIMKDASDLMLSTVQNQCDATLATLEKQYLQGEISQEEYEEKKLEAEKKAAKEEYKIQMWQWSANILTAMANTALGITQALSSLPPPACWIAMGINAAAGAVQLASVIASKPVPPSFATGGIVQGNSYSGDKIRANVNSGEMILNAAQQRSLWEVANGRGAASGGNTIVIRNSASNVVTARPQIDKNKIDVWIDMRVQDGLKNGRYDKALAMANQGMGGEYYGV